MAIAVRSAGEGDEAHILALNAACVPAVSEIDAGDYAQLRGFAHSVLVAEDDGAFIGFIVLVPPGTAYDSDNYGWFEQRYARHLYIDRVCVSDAARGRGAGRALYDAALRLADSLGLERLTAEVNEQPPNPQSMAFHERLGFRYLHTRPSGDTTPVKIVNMLERPL